MGRIIKFKGISVETGEWVYGHLIIGGQKAWIISGVIEINRDNIFIDFWVTVKIETVGQFTGLSNATGVEIYEGDKISFTASNWQGCETEYQGYVVYSGSGFEIWKSPDDEFYGDDGGFSLDVIVAQDNKLKMIVHKYELSKGDK